MGTPSAGSNADRRLTEIGWALFFGLAAVQFGYIWHYAVNIPFGDEWDALAPGALGSALNWHFLTSFHNEHRIIWTNLETWILYRLDGWNIVAEVALNYLLYLGVAGALTLMFRKTIGSARMPYWPWLLLPWVSASSYENLDWGFQSQFHLVLIFFFLSGWAILCSLDNSEKRSPYFYSTIAGLFLSASVFSFSSGLPGGFGLLLGASILAVGREPEARAKRQALARLSPAIALFAISCLLWIQGYQKPTGHPAVTLPWHLDFWRYLFHLIARGFGYAGRIDKVIGFAFLATMGACAVSFLRRERLRWSPSFWIWLSIALGILAMLSAIDIGRAGFGVNVPVSSRYSEIACLLIYPLAVILSLATSARWVPFALLAFLTIGYVPRFDFSIYGDRRQSREEARDCVHRFYAGQGNGLCLMTYPAPIPNQLRHARELGVSFARENSGP